MKVQLTKNRVLSSLFCLLFLTNIFQFFTKGNFLPGDIISLITLFLVPGTLLFLILKIKHLSFWEIISMIIGLSLLFLMGAGLIINILLPFIQVSTPLLGYPLLVSFDVFLLILGGLAFYRIKDNSLFQLTIQPKNIVLYLIPPLFVLLSTMGAISLNNGGTNIFTMILFAVISLFVLLITIFINKVPFSILPYSVYFISLSLLLCTSLRGWYTTGHDIQIEYYVFHLTKTSGYWDMIFYKSAYNACLSITLLPTILSNFFHVNDVYIFKVIYQALFSIVPVTTFLLFKKFSSRVIAFISTFQLMLFPTFTNDMAMLNRQEIALIFFGLMLLILFNSKISKTIKNTLFIFFGVGMVLSHYSTTYISLGLFGLAYILISLYRNNTVKRITSNIIQKGKDLNLLNPTNDSQPLSLIMVASLLILTFSWIAFTHSAGNLSNVTTKILSSLSKPDGNQNKSADTFYSLFNWNKLNSTEKLANYVKDNDKIVKETKNRDDFYDGKISNQYPVISSSETVLPLTSFGKTLSNIHINIFTIIDGLRQSYAKLIQAFIVLGIVVLLLYRKRNNNINLNYIFLSIAALSILFLLVLLPSISAEYGILRAFQQMLMLLALPVTIGCIYIFNMINKKYSLYLCVCLFIFYFLIMVGALQQITGGYYGLLRLNNMGLYYDMYYPHKSELVSMDWLAAKRKIAAPIQTSLYSGSKLLANNGLFSSSELLPSLIHKSGYVYIDNSKVKNQKDIIFYSGDLLIYKYPINFLENNKNLIYNNGGTKIYK
jgi:uncharacterized membrane protein